MILTEDDSRFCLDIANTKDGKFITMNSNSRTSSEERTIVSVLLSVCINVNSFFVLILRLQCRFGS